MVEELLVVTDESEDSRSGGQIPEKSFRIFLFSPDVLFAQ
jgi:hypothetical protein